MASQCLGSFLGVAIALIGGGVVYGVLKLVCGGLKLTEEEEQQGADLSIHHISATPGKESPWG